MKTYACSFVAVRVGAIGRPYNVSTTVQADSPEAARLKLYDTWEHIHGLTVHEVDPKYVTE
jgi:hypothetical protein